MLSIEAGTDLEAAVSALFGFDVRPEAILVAWAGALPTVLVVPAFGLGILPPVVRLAFGLALSLPLLTAVPIDGDPRLVGPLALAVLRSAVRGVPVALVASLSLWAAAVAGGLSDRAIAPGDGIRARPGLSLSFGLAAAALFFELDGASRVVEALAVTSDSKWPLGWSLRSVTAGLDLGVTLAIPILVVALVIDVALAIIAREIPSLKAAALAPLRTLAVLLVLSALFDEMMSSIGRAV